MTVRLVNDDDYFENLEIHVLIVDDDEDDYLLASEMLKDSRFRFKAIEWANSFEKAIETLDSGKFDICLVDYYIGAQTGLDLLKQMQEKGNNVPMILLTGLGDNEVDMAAMNAGAVDYLEKTELSSKLLERTLRYSLNQVWQRNELEEKTQLLKTILDNTSAGIAAFDRRMVLREWNDRFLTALGMANKLNYIDAPEDRFVAQKIILSESVVERLGLERKATPYQFELKSDDGRIHEVHYNPMPDGGSVVVCVDVTDRKVAEDRLVEAVEKAEDGQAAAGTAKPETRILSSVHLGDVVAGVVSDFSDWIEVTGAKIEIGALPTIDADPSDMRQLMRNLIGNALKFHKPGAAPLIKVHGTLTEADEASGATQTCRLSIEDNGVGFDQTELERMVGLFERLHDRGASDGTGAGLVTCRRILERHGGVLTADGRPGEGARFTVDIPVRQVLEEPVVKPIRQVV